ncbi:MAG: flagellar M-ring protein FliF [bacterium]|nr:flagellar M-ring protein FliF [bacterium]
MNGFDKLLQGLASFWAGLNAAQRVAFVSIAMITIGTVSLLTNLASQKEYSTLFSQLEPKDAARIADELATLEVPYELTHAGTTVQVPSERVYDLRLELASKGLGVNGPVGFEAFDEGGLGMTPFQERVRYRRALEGELSRTISALAQVEWARVHINVPEKALFQRAKKKATASVVLNLGPGRALSGGEVSGIGQLISGAVEGLAANQVTILDTSGRLLARPGSSESDVLAAEALDVQRSIEKRLAGRAQTLLDAAVGAGKSVITVAAQVERRRVEEDQDRVNPKETAVLSEQRTEESRSEPRLTAAGIPGTRSNVPPGGAEESSSQPSTENVTRETINFEISRSRSHTVIPMGEIQRLSIAVLVDGTYTTPEAVEGEPAPTPEYQPRTPEEVKQILEIVKRAVGFDEVRGDLIEVQSMPFRSPLEDVAAEPLPIWQSPEVFMLLPGIARSVAVIGGLLLLIFLVIRPALRQLAVANVVAVSSAETGATGEISAGGEPQLAIASEADRLASTLSNQDPKVIADAMKQWLRE